MYSFQFIHESNEDNSIFLFAEDYNQAVIKIKQIKIPDFKLKEWQKRRQRTKKERDGNHFLKTIR